MAGINMAELPKNPQRSVYLSNVKTTLVRLIMMGYIVAGKNNGEYKYGGIAEKPPTKIVYYLTCYLGKSNQLIQLRTNQNISRQLRTSGDTLNIQVSNDFTSILSGVTKGPTDPAVHCAGGGGGGNRCLNVGQFGKT